MAQRLLVAVVS